MLLQVFMLSQIWSYVNADIRHCDNSTSQYSVEGTDVSLCCYLSEAACNETTDNDTLVLRPLNSGTGSTTLGHVRVSTCAARLDITNVTSEFYEYTCLRNNVSLNITYIVTLPRPQTPVIRSIVCSVNKDMTLTFDTGKADNFSTSYVITLIEPRRTYILCNGSILSGETGTCRYTNTDISNTFRTTNSTISIVLARPSMNNIVVSTVVNSSVLLYHYVQPSPAEGLRLLNISATEAVVMWRPSDALRDLIKFLNLYGCSLMYQILLESGRETRQAVFKKYFDNQPRKYQYVVIRLDNLTSFTDYNLTVTGRSCWQSSEARQLPFTTLKSVPTISPKIDDFSYGWLDPTDTSQSSIPKLWVTWEPLAQEEKGDTNVTYDVTINDKQTLTTSRSFFVTPTSETGQMRIQIRAVNSIGQSVNQSVIIIPPYTARVGPGVVVDVDGDTANVFVNISSTEVVDLIAIHWCEGDRTEENLDLCKGYPQSQTKQLVSTNLVDTNTYSIQVTQPPVDQQVEINREMDYYDIENVSELGTNSPQKVNVNITIRPRLLTAEYNQSSNFTQEGEQLTGVYTAQFSETLRFYVSVKSGGLWRGMTSSGCYFNRDKDHIEVVSKLFGQDGTTMFRFQQRCDPTTPVQFRAEYFGVFSATDENCRVNRAKICSTRSRTFNYSLVQLPPDLQYVCLEASNHDNSSKKMVAVTAVDSYTGDVSVDNFNKNYLFIIIGVVAFVIAVVILVL
ncbi:uncharacterized protein LOC131955753 isoform X2 [Physella acuta]|uniref:uncharacterized protein LOC131955753 isoform X2 n=1 Tax=Physella acuta TaxID=109671 RepID=UPI0027DC6373|nr:uncharacterized protein LOC131955753 isoform X2 [Physella acuta]